MTRDHHINVFHSHDDSGYIADIPDLDACSAFGFGASPQAAGGSAPSEGRVAGRRA